MSIWWDSVNKWLYFGTKQGQANQFILTFDNWLEWINPPKYPTIRDWSLFRTAWDNGAWWGTELGPIEKVTIPRMNGNQIESDELGQRAGILHCAVQVIILGIGIRYQYQRDIVMQFPISKIEMFK